MASQSPAGLQLHTCIETAYNEVYYQLKYCPALICPTLSRIDANYTIAIEYTNKKDNKRNNKRFGKRGRKGKSGNLISHTLPTQGLCFFVN